MGASSSVIKEKQNNLFDLKNLPEDQYVCSDCDSIPEIISLSFNKGIIEFRCKEHGIKKIDIKEYFLRESKYLYSNIKCYLDQSHTQKDQLDLTFNYFIEKKKNICQECSKGKVSKYIKVNEVNNVCQSHLRLFVKYCNECNKHFCSEDTINCGHKIVEIENPNKEEIEIIRNKRNILMKETELNGYLIKLLDTFLKTYKRHPSNYYNSINIKNMANDIIDKQNMNFTIYKNDDLNIISKEKKVDNKSLLDKIEYLQKKILNIINTSLDVNLTGNEITINLNGKNVGNIDLGLLCSVRFQNLQIIDLSNNRISNLDEIKNLDSPDLRQLILNHNKIEKIEPLNNPSISKLKILDLSYNHIEQITALSNIINNNTELEKINLKNNRISNVETLKNNIPIYVKEINLDENNIIQKDLDEIKLLILKRDKNYIIYKVESNNDIKLFSRKFVERNNEKCKIIINGKEKEISSYYDHKEIEANEKHLKVKLKIIENITDLSDMFSGCSNLLSIDGLSNLETENVSNMSNMFSECSSLSSIDGISDWKTYNVITMNNMFSKCSSLSSLKGISKWKTMNVKNMNSMFFRCSSLKSLEELSEFQTENVIDMSYIFSGCSSLTTLNGLSKWKTKNVKFMSGMFSGCSSLLNLKGLSNWEIDNSTNINQMFFECKSLSNLNGISKWKTKNVIDISGIFAKCSSLSNIDDISEWTISSVINMSKLFLDCSLLSNVNGLINWDTGNVKDMSKMFSGCSSLSNLKGLSKWDTRNVINMNNMFFGCSKLSSLEPISQWKTKNVNDLSYMFSGCSSLSSINEISNWTNWRRKGININNIFP